MFVSGENMDSANQSEQAGTAFQLRTALPREAPPVDQIPARVAKAGGRMPDDSGRVGQGWRARLERHNFPWAC